MLDIKYIRKNKVKVINKLKSRGDFKNLIEKVLTIDKQYREKLQEREKINSQRNKLNNEIKKLTGEEKKKVIKESAVLKKEEQTNEINLKELNKKKEELDIEFNKIPNIPADDVKIGKDEKDNRAIKIVGKPSHFSFQPKNYMQLATQHDIIDVKRAAKVSGSRFGYLKNEGALLWNALVQYTLSILLEEKFIPFFSPALVKGDIMKDSGYDSYTDVKEAYYLQDEDLYLVGTGEHALLPYHRDEILDEKNLPLYYTTYSSCFRREAGSYGKDTKGILRVHQFDKQEMLIITTPDKSWKAFDHLIKIQEKIINGLDLAYQLLEVCTGDLPKPSAKVIDLECWMPSENRYRETHSASNCTDYQARRNKIRYQDKEGNKQNVHILNATAITPRTLIAILENNQQKDGSIKIPKVLQSYLNGLTVISKRK